MKEVRQSKGEKKSFTSGGSFNVVGQNKRQAWDEAWRDERSRRGTKLPPVATSAGKKIQGITEFLGYS